MSSVQQDRSCASEEIRESWTSCRPVADYLTRVGQVKSSRSRSAIEEVLSVLRDRRVKSAGKHFPGTPRVSMCIHEKEEEQLSVIGRSSP